MMQNRFTYILLSVAIVSLMLVLSFLFTYNEKISKLAYVDTSKLMIGFSEANKIQKELKAEDEKWKAEFKILQDSLSASIKLMSKEYDKAKPARKKELQDILSANNQRVNNFKIANQKKMEKLTQEKMAKITEMINVYVQEYGKKHKYSIIFGTTVTGNIIYADEKKLDVTDEIIKGLNERYK